MWRAFQKQEAEKAANNICFAYFNIQVPPSAPIPPLIRSCMNLFSYHAIGNAHLSSLSQPLSLTALV